MKKENRVYKNVAVMPISLIERPYLCYYFIGNNDG